MKATSDFKEIIENHLKAKALTDKAFDVKLGNESKSIEDCITYILNTVKKSGNSGFSDTEVFGMAIHYYDENKIDIGGKVEAKVVVNHTAELSEGDIEKAKQAAMDQLIEEQKAKLTAKKQIKNPEIKAPTASLFD